MTAVKRKATGAYACSKAARAGDKNATRWPGYRRTSGMRCVIARAEPATDGAFASLRKAYFP
ncbi:conserved hypothetical protein [Pantoea brenneri]|uniref:Uncharacterized protein n=1 Tax=Pantoea brenneri TaxID=472694 RepID=A0AAX3J5T6_9GAMM|nr:conserved hypothetical protein [Pantoea brenneri]